jgi:hypothetical protein
MWVFGWLLGGKGHYHEMFWGGGVEEECDPGHPS